MLFIILMYLFTHNDVVKELACQSETRYMNGVYSTKWVCPTGITFVESST